MTRKDFELIAETIRHGALSEVGKRAMAEAFAEALAGVNARFDRQRFMEACMLRVLRDDPDPERAFDYRVVRMAFGGIADEAVCPTLDAAELWVHGAAGREGHTLDNSVARYVGSVRVYDVLDSDAAYRIELVKRYT